MTTWSISSNPITMKINRDAHTLEIQWDRKSTTIERILDNLQLFGIEATQKIKNQIITLSSIGGKKSNMDIIHI